MPLRTEPSRSTALERLRTPLTPADLRGATYLRTYPSLMAICDGHRLTHDRFQLVCLAAYGWMPRILHLDAAVAAAAAAQGHSLDDPAMEELDIASLVACLHSNVGASKVLHAVNPAVFPILDASIDRLLVRAGPARTWRREPADRYRDYLAYVHGLRTADWFGPYCDALRAAYRDRLHALGIPDYPITEVRLIEAALFEIARAGPAAE